MKVALVLLTVLLLSTPFWGELLIERPSTWIWIRHSGLEILSLRGLNVQDMQVNIQWAPTWCPLHALLQMPVFRNAADEFRLVLPHWMTFGIPTLVLSGWWFARWIRGRKRKIGYCCCGYDLTGNVSGRCPECGSPIGLGVSSHAANTARKEALKLVGT